MLYRKFGRTNLQVSVLSMGTVSLGMDYGIERPGDFGCPEESLSIQLLQAAADGGINLFDTAPGYGKSETVLGKALGHRTECLLATKVSVPRGAEGGILSGKVLWKLVENSLEHSRTALRRDALDIVQIHNATEDLLKHNEVMDYLSEAKDKGIVRFLGASVYTEPEAMAVIRDGRFDVLQVAYNLLDQHMAEKVFPAANESGMSLLTRSALLKGVLTGKAKWLPQELQKLQASAERAKDLLSVSWEKLPEVALRFCASNPLVSSVLIGSRTIPELEAALSAMSDGPLSYDLLKKIESLAALSDPTLLNPSNWSIA
ncbi:MAG: Oxidoreductase, aldo/keto reductase family [Parcubacteria group bacterium GW2011_GWC2_42_12]|nr:MAG: Oxidoreductase, aldo/keto reductase family [Parcubacteria group bacterium GW2011_GWC2_42_12]